MANFDRELNPVESFLKSGRRSLRNRIQLGAIDTLSLVAIAKGTGHLLSGSDSNALSLAFMGGCLYIGMRLMASEELRKSK